MSEFSQSNELENERSVQRLDAIISVHSKLLRARRNDVSLSLGDADNSHRNAPQVVQDLGQGVRNFRKINLVPRAGYSPQAGITNLIVKIPIDSWEDATEYARKLYVYTSSSQQMTPESIFVDSLSGPVSVYGPSLLVTAHNTAGESLNAVLSPGMLRAVENWNDVAQLPKMSVANGDELTVTDTAQNIYLQKTMEQDWFTEPLLRDLVRDYDPITATSNTNYGSVA